jgi:hypothetical protein
MSFVAPPSQFPRGLKRAEALARHLGVSHGYFWGKIRPRLTPYQIDGVFLFDVAQAEGLVKLRSTPPRQTPRKPRNGNGGA